MSIQHISNHDFQEEVLNSEKPVLLDFWAPWCGPCRMVGPILEEIAAERPDVKVCKVNIDEAYDLAARYRIVSIPTLMVLENGKMKDRAVGTRPKEQILAMLG